MIRSIRKTRLWFVAAVVTVAMAGTVFSAQQLKISKNPDFSTDDRVFERSDVLYIQVTAPDIDYTDIDKNELRLKPDSGGDDIEKHLRNNLDGTYEASFDLTHVGSGESEWEIRVRIEDHSDNEFRRVVEIKIHNEDHRDHEIEFTGRLQTITATSVTIKDLEFLLNEQTQLLDNNNLVIELVDLQPTDLVEVKAFVDGNGNRVAVRIKIEDDNQNPAGDEVELKGAIESIDSNSIVVLGKTFVVDSNTEILNHENEATTFASLLVGQTVEVRADVRSDGSLLATRIRAKDINGDGNVEVEFTGLVTALSATSITVDAIAFEVTVSTSVLDTNGLPVDFSVLVVGHIVEIRAERQADGSLRATDIKLEDRSQGSDDELEFTAEVTAITSSSIVAGGVTFTVDQQTVILDNSGRTIPFSMIQSGFVVEVRGSRQIDGVWLATHIKIEDFFNDEIELIGRIESIGTGELVVSGNVFVVDAATAILDNNNATIGFQDLQAGMLVEIRADILLDGTLRASDIKIEDDFQDEVELTGTIETVGADNLLVSGLLFHVDGNTIVVDNNQQPFAFANLIAGQIVEVRADKQPDGRLLATNIRLEDRLQDEVELTGVIEAITANSITVGGIEFQVVENTIVFNNRGNQIAFGDLTIEMVVEVRGDILPDGTRIAIRIKLEDGNADEVEVVGAIDSLSADGLSVLGLWLSVDESTAVLDRDNNPIDFFSLFSGHTVEVKADRLADGTLQVIRIKREDILILSGALETVVKNGVALAGQSILFSSETIILSKLNEFISIDDLSAGQVVEVRAQQFDGATVFATKVRTRDSRLVTTSVEMKSETKASLPSNFALEQNYPNPFNPTTSIGFRISGSGSVSASLIVYNLMGQKVRVLLDSDLAPGDYSVTWDGRDHSGRNLATGVYLYELKTGGISSVKRMLLMR